MTLYPTKRCAHAALNLLPPILLCPPNILHCCSQILEVILLAPKIYVRCSSLFFYFSHKCSVVIGYILLYGDILFFRYCFPWITLPSNYPVPGALFDRSLYRWPGRLLDSVMERFSHSHYKLRSLQQELNQGREADLQIIIIISTIIITTSTCYQYNHYYQCY